MGKNRSRYYDGAVPEDFDRQVSGVAALADELRRRIYDHVVAQPNAVSRDAAAQAAGIKRSLAAFHLDKLVAEGLLEVEYRRLSGKTGPGAGRPAKLYRRAATQFDVTLPPREYDVAGHILAAAIAKATAQGADVVVATHDVAFERGQALGVDAAGQSLAAVLEILRDNGFEPRVEDGRILLANCPFHRLAQDFPDLVCGMNLALCQGVVSALPEDREGLVARLDPEPGRCCVTFEIGT